MNNFYFLQMIEKLRTEEEVVLYGNILVSDEGEDEKVTSFLKSEFEKERLNFLNEAPSFNSNAALWAAKYVYLVAQLIVYRKNNSLQLREMLQSFNGEKNIETFVSADLCLRFLPDMIVQLKLIDADDELIPMLEEILLEWHYSGIKYFNSIPEINYESVTNNLFFLQLYLDRIIESENKIYLESDCWKNKIKASLGLNSAQYWKLIN